MLKFLKNQSIHSYDSKNLHELYSAIKLGIPNITLQKYDEYRIYQFFVAKQTHFSFFCKGFLTGCILIKFDATFKIPNVVYHYGKLLAFWNSIVHFFRRK